MTGFTHEEECHVRSARTAGPRPRETERCDARHRRRGVALRMDRIVKPPSFGGDLGQALAEINAPAYILDHNGVIRWMNARAIELLGDHRGAHYLAPVAPEGTAASRLAFTKKRLG